MPARRVGFYGLIHVVLSLLVVGCGGDPPNTEIEQAQGAIAIARAAGADRYAREEFTAAEDSLKHAHDAVDDRDYRLALNRALDSRDRAQTAAKEAADNKAAARTTATQALTAADATLAGLRARIAAPAVKAARPEPQERRDMRSTVTDAEAAVQKARTAFDAGDYLSATDSLKGAMASLQAVARKIDAPPTPPARRRR